MDTAAQPLTEANAIVPVDPEKIISDVTLEIDEKAITVTDFKSAVEHFLGLVREVSLAAAPDKDPNAWLVDVYPGSMGLGLRARAGGYSRDEVNVIRKAVVSGLRDLQSSRKSPLFNDRALDHSKVLGGLISRKNDALMMRVLVGKGEETLTISKSIAKGVDYVTSPSNEQEGSIDGVLETISAHQQNEFVVYDALSRRGIRCYISEQLFDEALPSFRKRVEVFGLVQYRADGQPVSVKAQSIVPFPSDDEIPSVEEMRRLLSGS